ncbi:hypothetical protein ACLB2K_027843 [Fragaria x ananassa]
MNEIKIEKIESLPARQVTFSKRRKGLFKKAGESSVFCDAKVAVIFFSSTDKLYELSTSSTKDIIARYKQCTKDDAVEESADECMMRLTVELAEKIRELRHMEGKDLEELDIDELQRLENMIEGGLSRVVETKDQRIMSQIQALETKGAELAEENNLLIRQRLGTLLSMESSGISTDDDEQGMASESCTISTSCFTTGSSTSSTDDSSSSSENTLSLKLGLPRS